MEFISTLQTGMQAWYDERSPMVVAMQIGLLVVAALTAWFIQRHLKKELTRRLGIEGMSEFRSTLLKLGQRLVFPVTFLLAVVLGRLVLQQFGYTTPVLNLLAKLLLALAIIRTIVYALRVGIVQGPALKAWEQVISSSIWILVALHLLGPDGRVERSLFRDPLPDGAVEIRYQREEAGEVKAEERRDRAGKSVEAG